MKVIIFLLLFFPILSAFLFCCSFCCFLACFVIVLLASMRNDVQKGFWRFSTRHLRLRPPHGTMMQWRTTTPQWWYYTSRTKRNNARPFNGQKNKFLLVVDCRSLLVLYSSSRVVTAIRSFASYVGKTCVPHLFSLTEYLSEILGTTATSVAVLFFFFLLLLWLLFYSTPKQKKVKWENGVAIAMNWEKKTFSHWTKKGGEKNKTFKVHKSLA